MHLATFSYHEKSTAGSAVGALLPDGDHLLDLTAASKRHRPADARHFVDMLALIQAGPAALSMAREWVAGSSSAEGVALARVKLRAPLPRPEQIRCFSAFAEHGVRSAQVMLEAIAAKSPDPLKAREELRAKGPFQLPKLWYERPLYYKANRFSVVGTEEVIDWPSYSERVDFELELACVIGARGKDVARPQADRHIFGYTVCNDLSARDTQAIEMQAPLGPAKSKDFDGGLAMGPWIATHDEFDRTAAAMIVRVNGEEWSRGHARDMHHSFERMIEYVSQSETLYPGEVFLSGCVGGGSGVELGRFAQRGDVIELEIVGIGTLRNRIA